MSGLLHTILRKLADGSFHSGTLLGKELQVSRAAIWKTIRKLQALGLEIHCVRGKGYRLLHPVNLLDSSEIKSALSENSVSNIQKLEILDTVDSTNSHAMRLLQGSHLFPETGKYVIYLAEQQTQGKGRRGRYWVSPWGQNIYLTMVRLVDTGSMNTEGVSLIIGLAIIRALREQGIEGIGVKWPNDVVIEGKKLAGILLEISGDISGICQLLIGVGINIRCNPGEMQAVEQPWTDLEQVAGKILDRNLLVATVITHIMTALDEFSESGLACFMDEWQEYDVMRGREVELITASGSRFGKALGISETGALLLETAEGVQSLSGGEISLRSNPAP